jgi:tetratricopeptide (TPR) repeat protein
MGELRPGDVFANRFEIERAAGAGGMGTVYRAIDRVSGDVVALKLLSGRVPQPHLPERFAREAELLASLRHPGIVSYVAHGQTPEGKPFLALEWLDGEDLGRRLKHSPLSLNESLQLLYHIAGALAAAHQRGILHRDLKPSNLFLVGGEVARVKILDFGIARHLKPSKTLTRTGVLVGTPEYMAPEQARGERGLTPAADIFSLGCVLYECLAGESAFVGEHVAAVLVRILFEEPVTLHSRRPGVPAAVTELLEKMLAKNPKQRLSDASALLAELAAIGELPDLPEFPTPPTAHHKSQFAESEQALFSLVVAADGSHELGSTIGPEDADPEAAGREALLRALQSMGVRADFLVGGALVAIVSQTGSVTDQAGLAAQAALLIKERWPAAQVSVATGRGVIDGGSAVGEVAERAAHLLRGPTLDSEVPTLEIKSGVWLDELSARLLGPRFVIARSADGVQLLGAEKDVDSSRPLLGKPTPCVGRDAELVMLEGQLNGCIENSEARALLMLAPPGVGKSRLRHEFLRRIDKREEPLTVLLGRGDLISAGAPCAILAQVIRRLCGIGGSEPIEEQRRLLSERVGRHLPADEVNRHVTDFIGEVSGIPFVAEAAPTLREARKDHKVMSECIRRAFLDWLAAECAAAPVLLVLDDLQWGDALTLSFLGDALRQLQGSPLFMLGLARPEINETFPPLRQNHKLQQIQLNALSKKACERLVYQVLGKEVAPEKVARAVEHAAGNALYLEEMIRAIADGKSTGEREAPETVIAMLQARIGRFDPGPRLAVRAAALFGQTFWHGGVATLLALPPSSAELESWLSALVDAEVIERRDHGRLADQQEYAFRHALVRDAAYGLLRENDLVTGHYLAGKFLEAAGERDAIVIAEHYRRGGDLERATPLYQRAGDEAAWLGFQSAARAHYATALSTLEQLPERPDLLRSKLDLLLRQIEAGLLTEARDVQLARLATARGVLDKLGTEKLDGPDRLRLARIDFYQGRLEYYGGRSQQAIAYYERVIPVAREFGDREMLVLPSYVIGMALMMQGQMRGSRETLGQVLEPLREIVSNIDWLRAVFSHNMTVAATGDYRAALDKLPSIQALAVEAKQPLIRSLFHIISGVIRYFGLDWAESRKELDRGMELAQEAGDKMYIYLAGSMRAWPESFLGLHEQARAGRQRSIAIAQEMGGRLMYAEWFEALDVDCAFNAGRFDEALERARVVSGAARETGQILAQGVAERVWGKALVQLSDGNRARAEEADAHFARSLEVFESGGLKLEMAHTRLRWGEALLARDRPDAADEQLRSALAQFSFSDCDVACEQVRRLLSV